MPRPISPAHRPDHPLVFAHRGGRALAPENTIPAFEAGLAAGADGLELDVHLSRDGIPVVQHDADLDRCTNATGPIAARTAAELAAVDAAHSFERDDGRRWAGQGIGVPSLAEVLARFPAVPLIIEIKAGTPETATAVVETIRAADAIERVCIGSFSLVTLQTVRRLEPRLATSAAKDEGKWSLYRSWIGIGLGRPPYRAFQVPERVGRLTVISPRFIRAAHRAGLVVQVWTVNEEADMRRLFDWGVDGLITDCPDLAVRVRDEWVRERRSRG